MNPDATWRKYKKIQLDPVTVWLGPNSKMQEMKPEDRQRLANTLWSQLNEQLSKDYGMTKQLGPDVMRVQVAITEGEASNTTMAAVFTIVPQLSTLSTGTSMETGVAAFAASASAEIKVTDGATGTLLFAGVDRRGGIDGLIREITSVKLRPGKYRLQVKTTKESPLPPEIATSLRVAPTSNSRELKDNE